MKTRPSHRPHRAALLSAAFLLAACNSGEDAGGLSRDETERLDNAAGMLNEEEGRFEDREVDEMTPEDEPPEDGESEAE